MTARFIPWSLLAVILVFDPLLDSPFHIPKLFLLSLCALAGMTAAALPRATSPGNHAHVFLWASYAAVVTVTVVSAATSGLAWLAAERLILLIAGALLLRALELETRYTLLAIAVSGITVAAIALLQSASSLDLFALFGQHASAESARMRIFSTLGNPLFVGTFCAGSVWAALALGAKQRLWFLGAAVIVAGGLASRSRTFLVAFALGLGIYAVAQGGRRWKLAAIFIALAAGFLLWLMPTRPLEGAVSGRIFIWRTVALPVSMLGGGPGSFALVYSGALSRAYEAQPAAAARFAAYERHAHNDLVEALVESGWAGALAWLALLAAAGNIAVRNRGSHPEASAGIAALLVAATADFPFARPESWLLFLMWISVPAGALVRRAASRSVGGLAVAAFGAGSSVILGAILLLASRDVFLASQAEAAADLVRAEALYRAALRAYPGQTNAHFGLTRVLGKQGRYAECIAASRQAERWIHEAELLLLRVRAYAALERPDLARAELRRARAQFPWSSTLAAEARQLSTPPNAR